MKQNRSITRKALIQDHRSTRRFLVPVDFSDCSRAALAYAEALASTFNAKVTVVNVLPLNEGLLHVGAEQFPLLEDELRENRRRKLQAFVSEIIRKPAGCLVGLGHPVREILRLAKKIDATEIVISTHGLTGVRHALLGSVAERVVRHARCPVWIVPCAKPKPRVLG